MNTSAAAFEKKRRIRLGIKEMPARKIADGNDSRLNLPKITGHTAAHAYAVERIMINIFIENLGQLLLSIFHYQNI